MTPKCSDSPILASYYSCNCFKGGIGLQLGGWIHTHDLWTGCVRDTAYQGESDIFEIQKAFCELDRVNGNVVPFTNVFDKGYRNRLQAWLVGNQLTLQPVFAKSDEKSFEETIHCHLLLLQLTDPATNEQ